MVFTEKCHGIHSVLPKRGTGSHFTPVPDPRPICQGARNSSIMIMRNVLANNSYFPQIPHILSIPDPPIPSNS